MRLGAWFGALSIVGGCSGGGADSGSGGDSGSAGSGANAGNGGLASAGASGASGSGGSSASSGASGSGAGGSAGAGGSGIGVLFADDFSTLPTGPLEYSEVRNNPVFVAAGYDVSDPSLNDGVGAIELVSDTPELSNVTRTIGARTYAVPSTKANLLHISYGNEQQCMLRFHAGTDLMQAWMSWWEYRPPNQDFAGEKGNRINSRLPNGNVGLDVILGIGLQNGGNQTTPGITPGATLQMFAQGMHVENFDLGAVAFDWNTGSLHHFEVGLTLSTGTDSDGSTEVWLDGERVVNAQAVQYFNGSADVPPGIQSFEIGGWLSGGVGLVAPMQRYILGWRVATERQGPWPIE